MFEQNKVRTYSTLNLWDSLGLFNHWVQLQLIFSLEEVLSLLISYSGNEGNPNIPIQRGASTTNLPVTATSSFNCQFLQKHKVLKGCIRPSLKTLLSFSTNNTEKKLKVSKALPKALLTHVHMHHQWKWWQSPVTCHLLQTCLFSALSDSTCGRSETGSQIYNSLTRFLFHLQFFNSSNFLDIWFQQCATSLHELWLPLQIATLDEGDRTSDWIHRPQTSPFSWGNREWDWSTLSKKTRSVRQCYKSIIRVPYQDIVGVISIETHLKFFREHFPHDWHLLQLKTKKKFIISPLCPKQAGQEHILTHQHCTGERNCSLWSPLCFSPLDKGFLPSAPEPVSTHQTIVMYLSVVT